MNKPALTLKDITHKYCSHEALKGFSMEIYEGEVVCILGPSGCGKTTALRVAAGLEKPEKGQVIINEHVMTCDNRFVLPEERETGFVFQDYALFPHLTIEKNIAFGLRKKSASWQKEKVHKMLDKVGMSKYAQAYPHMLSGGQQQRIALARALAPEPKIILLDEPFSGLDARLRMQVRDEVLHILKATGTTVVMVTHDPEEAMFMGDRIILMNHGYVEQVGSPEELYSSPKSGFVAEFFGEINHLTGIVQDGIIVSPIGFLPLTKDMSNGEEVDIFVRPEALRLSEANSNPPIYAEVMVHKRLGHTKFLHLTLHDNTQDKSWHLHARMPSYKKIDLSKKYHVEYDTEQIFIFKKSGEKVGISHSSSEKETPITPANVA